MLAVTNDLGKILTITFIKQCNTIQHFWFGYFEAGTDICEYFFQTFKWKAVLFSWITCQSHIGGGTIQICLPIGGAIAQFAVVILLFTAQIYFLFALFSNANMWRRLSVTWTRQQDFSSCSTVYCACATVSAIFHHPIPRPSICKIEQRTYVVQVSGFNFHLRLILWGLKWNKN